MSQTPESERLLALEATDRCLSRLVRRVAETDRTARSERLAVALERARSRLDKNRHLLPQATRDSELWTREQYVDAADLAIAQRVELQPGALVPEVELVREVDKEWTPQDFAQLPTRRCHGPGYTLLRDVLLRSPGMAMADDGRFIEDAYTRLTPGGISPAFRRELLLGASVRSQRPIADEPIARGILISGPGLGVYGHQLLDYLPPLVLLGQLDLFSDWPVLISARSPLWVEPMIEMFAGAAREIRRFPDNGESQIPVGELVVPWFLREPYALTNDVKSARPRGAFHPSATGIFDVVAARAKPSDAGDGSRRIFVARDPSASHKRLLVNGAEIQALFESRGFRCVRPEQLSFGDQIRLFASAQVIAGEAGSGLHGTLFSPAGALTLELRPTTYHLLSQPAIAVLQGQRFASVAGSEQAGGSLSQDPWTIEPTVVERALTELAL